MAALKTDRVTVGTTAVRVGGTDQVVALNVLLRNRGSVAIYVGGADVTSTWGYQLDPGEFMAMDVLAADDGIWAVTASGSAVVHRIQRGI